MKLLDLPNEILAQIAEKFDQQSELAAFVRVNRRLYNVLVLYLYILNRNSQPFSRTAECWAVANGRIEVLRKVYSLGAQQDSGKIFYEAAEAGHVDVLMFLVESGPSKDRPTFSELIHTACESDNLEMIRFLLENGADADFRDSSNQTPIYKVSDSCAVELLVQHGADLNVRDTYGWSPLSWAARHRESGTVKVLFQNGVNIDAYEVNGNITVLQQAAIFGDGYVVDFLLKLGANPLIKCSEGKTALHYAVMRGVMPVVERFLDEECWDTEEVGDSALGRTPLHDAIANSNAEMVSLLLKSCSTWINKRDLSGRTPVFYAAKFGRHDILQDIMRHGGDLAIEDYFGATPIFAAVRNGRERLVWPLVQDRPTSIGDRDGFGHTIIWWAKKCGNQRILNLLMNYAKDLGFEIDASELQAEESIILHNLENCWCDMCTRSLGGVRNGHRCTECGDGLFIICHDCFVDGRLSCAPLHREEKWVPYTECNCPIYQEP